MTNNPSSKNAEKPSQLMLAKIASILDEFRVVINKGRLDGVKTGNKYLIYKIGDEIHDPDTKESLGQLEIVKGFGEIIHVQDKMATLQTTEKHEIQRKTPMTMFFQSIEISKEPKAFIDPEVGDIAKPIG